jgi:hypothetical protein
VLTIKLGLGKFRSEKWWEKKTSAYTAAFEALHAVYNHDRITYQMMQSEQSIAPANYDDVKAKCAAGLDDIRLAANVGEFILNERCHNLLNNLAMDLSVLDGASQQRGASYIDFLRKRKELIGNAMSTLRTEARKDLQTY